MRKIERLLTAYEQFSDALAKVKGLDVQVRPLRPSSEAEVAQVERALGVRVPDDLRAFWKRGNRNLFVSLGKTCVTNAVFVDATGALGQVKVALDVAKTSKDPAMLGWLRHGIPFQAEETYGFVDAGERGGGAVRQMTFDGDPTEEPVAPSFTDFFEAWLAAGCYDDGAADLRVFKKYWEKVSALVPVHVAPADNAWLGHLGRFHGKPKFFPAKKVPPAKRKAKAADATYVMAEDATTLWMNASWLVRKKKLDMAVACVVRAVELDPSMKAGIADDEDLAALHKNEAFRKAVGLTS